MNKANNLIIAEDYHNAMLTKDFNKMVSYLHDNVHFVGPLGEMSGKDTVAISVKSFAEILQDIQIRSRFADGHQIMLAYDMVLPDPIGKFRVAVLMEFTDGLISKIELFYDATPFQ